MATFKAVAKEEKMTEAIQYSNEEPKAAEQLPSPSGYRLLIALPEVDETTEGGLYIPEERRYAESVASIVGFVLKAGPDAYGDANKFPDGPWCQKGDWVIFARYAGSRLKIDGGDLRLLNDDEILAIIQDPTDILHM